MFKTLCITVILAAAAASAFAQGLVSDREVTINSPAEVAAARQALINFVWGPNGLPIDRLPVLPVIKNDISPIDGLADLERVDTLVIEMDRGVRSYAHHFIPRQKNSRLVILHHGHFASFDDSEISDDVDFGMRRSIQGLLSDGYSVLALYMPRKAVFKTSIAVNDDGGDNAHDELFELPKYQPESGHPMKYFLEPVTASLNYLASRAKADEFPAYTDFSMVGFSGGGWTATVYPAIDTRIGLSIAVAGSIPLYLRDGAAIGDTEQTLPGFYSIAGYPDLYVLASDGDERRHIQVLNRRDWCCFGELHHSKKHAGGLNYDEAVREYETKVRAALLELGNTELFRTEIDEAAPGHTVTWDAIFDTILPELNEGRRYIGSASGIEAAARSVHGRPLFFVHGVWNPNKLGLMVGTPAILNSAVNIQDMFYRTDRNQLVHVSRPPVIWSRAKLLSDHVITDPAAVSRTPGTADVIAVKRDYKLYHFHFDGANWTTELISEHVKGLGQPTVIASSKDRLDVFYRSFNRRLYQATKIGSEPWTIVDVGGRMLDFPSAVLASDGTFHAVVRGSNGELWHAEKPPGKDVFWGGWQQISITDGMVGGSPSASIRNGILTVSVRAKDGRMLEFSKNKYWTYIDRGGEIVGSPTATPIGTYVRDSGGSLVFLEGGKWTNYGGMLD